MNALLRAKDVTKTYEKAQHPGLNNISFSVAEGEFICWTNSTIVDQSLDQSDRILHILQVRILTHLAATLSRIFPKLSPINDRIYASFFFLSQNTSSNPSGKPST